MELPHALESGALLLRGLPRRPMTRNGKIARLPRAVRDELNQRLDNGQEAKDLAAWLNSLPEVQGVLAAYFSEQCAGAAVAGLPTRGPIKPN